MIKQKAIELLNETFNNDFNYDEEKEKALIIVHNYLDNYEREKAKRASFQYQTTEEIK